MRAKALFVVLTAALALLAASSAKADPNESCYLGNSQTSEGGNSDVSGMTRGVLVKYKIGYACTGNPVQVVVTEVAEVADWQIPFGGNHDIDERQVVDWYGFPADDLVWQNMTFDNCGASPCYVSETYHPNVYMPYNPSNDLIYSGYDTYADLPCWDFWHFMISEFKYTCDASG